MVKVEEEDDERMLTMLDGLRRFTLLVEGGLLPLAGFYGRFLEMQQDVQSVFKYDLHSNRPSPNRQAEFWFMNLADNGMVGLSALAQPGVAEFSAIARLLLQLPAAEATCERVISAMEIVFPKSRLGTRDDLMLADSPG